MIALSLTEEDRALLVLLSAEQAGNVIQALLGMDLFLSEEEQAVFDSIVRRQKKRKSGSERWCRWNQKRLSNGLSNSLPNGLTNAPPSPASPPVSPLAPPSPSPPGPPVFSPPYNPPSTSPSPTPASCLRDARASAYSPEFEAFWSVYPKKIGKRAAWKAFQRVKVPVETLVSAVERQKCSAQWREQNGRFIPNPATWLNQGRWEDEIQGAAPEERRSGWSTSNPFLELLEEERGK